MFTLSNDNVNISFFANRKQIVNKAKTACYRNAGGGYNDIMRKYTKSINCKEI